MTELISIPLKKSSDVDVIKPLQNLIKSTYSITSNQKDYIENIIEFSKLRKAALWKVFEKYDSSLEIIYRYYDQICALEGKIPVNELQIPFRWKDAFDRTIFGGKSNLTISTLAYEKMCVLYNIAALQSSVAATQSLETDEGLKLSAKLFQQSAGIFNYLKSNVMLNIHQELTPDMSPETLEALSVIMIAQAQEIFTHKAVHDKMKDSVIAKLAAQTEEFYSEALKLFQKDIFRTFWDKDWIPLISGKQLIYRGISEYYQSLVCKCNKYIGEEIARLELAVEMFKSAQTKSNKLLMYQDYYNKAIKNLNDAKKDNDFIYHERIPDINNLSTISKASVAKLLPLPDNFSLNFQDIFAELLPICIHQAISNFEAQKNEIIICEIAKLRNMRQILNGTLASLNLPAAIEDINGTEIPQSLIDKANFINEAGGIKSLESTMNELPELLQRNKDILDEADRMLNDEQNSDDNLRIQFKDRWKRVPSGKLTDHFKTNAQKYRGIINNAISADKVIREKFEMHRENVNILSMEPHILANYIPTGCAIQESSVVLELRKLMEVVETLKVEQDAVECELQSVTIDIQGVFLSAFAKGGSFNENDLILENIGIHYSPLQKKVRECILRQEKLIENIQYKHMAFAKEQSSCGSTREQMLRKLANAYDAYKELINNLQEGVKFYNDLTQLLVYFQNKVSDFCFARKTEKEELLKDLTTNLSQNESSGSLNLPSHHPGISSTQTNLHTSHLPYPVQDQGHMPIPYEGTQVTLYPNYISPPMPATFNPYATIIYPTQDGYLQQPLHQTPYEKYSTHSQQNLSNDGNL
ncbi:PREDICTED: programmed cell death 6-interacting protein [Ceratosolen solmsi marchali]|uniref:Programmed cell death 6-interacting protein n=1 Tax=Ceratosolen solmsi marchali TaxID=326594 RepID=A0AAJ6YW34_9HYME|nr:PREDICTED: programmed cell death 6-interacting protein [Ceratosolen solmsi marchali]